MKSACEVYFLKGNGKSSYLNETIDCSCIEPGLVTAEVAAHAKPEPNPRL